ncbi:hypothetical protein RQL81_13430 [Citrobacter braakii]|nr:hypothetical protein [Citrobacter braakii]
MISHYLSNQKKMVAIKKSIPIPYTYYVYHLTPDTIPQKSDEECAMITDVAGKVRNLKLKPSERLVPLFEAIINSIQASSSKADIEIEFLRDLSQLQSNEEDMALSPIESITIADSGAGFNPYNLDSFKTAESSFKSELGCKGVGRFTWLKVFNSISIDSDYYENNKLFNVSFDFTIEDDSLDDVKPKLSDKNIVSPITLITFKDIKSPYREKMPVSLEDYCDEIIQHCITYFIDNKISRFMIYDNIGQEYDLLEYFNKNYSSDIAYSSIKIGNHYFKIVSVKNYNHKKTHKIYFCADSRTVTNYNISNYINDISNFFLDENNDKFRYSIYVYSDYLDNNLTQERTSFSINENDDLIDKDFPSIYSIITEILINCDSIFSIYLEPMRAENLNRITEYIERNGYEYRFLLKHRPQWLSKIKFGLNDNELDIELHRLYRDFESDLKREAIKIKSSLKEHKILSSGDYKKAYEKYTTALNDVGKSNLAKYIVHRKSIIDIFELSLEIQSNDKYALENAVHDIIYPMKSTSEDTTTMFQNLWMIDERMSYHTLLASDQPFNQFCDIQDKSRPDIIIFDNPILFTEEEKKPSSATIIEFKRPMRDDYDYDDNPVSQVIGYVRKLREPNKVKTNKGRDVHLSIHVPIYCYIICDLTKSIRDHALNQDYISTPDNEGYIWYHKSLNTYVEIISFDKIVSDARKRNNILFKMLNIE